VTRSLAPIATRSIDSLIRTQGTGELYPIFARCIRDGHGLILAFMPSGISEKPPAGFDLVYIRKLFELGRETARAGYPRHKGPPGFEVGKTP
jgi:hypothetical protein